MKTHKVKYGGEFTVNLEVHTVESKSLRRI